jgi:isopenicillin N synthase-like dioxygenase
MSIPVSRRLDFSEIPVIDLAPVIEEGDDAAVIAELGKACTDIGFIYVKNHRVAKQLVCDMHKQAALFFNLPEEQKMRIVLDPQMRGYLPLFYQNHEGEERQGTNHQEGFWIGHERPLNPQRPLDGLNRWPPEVPGLQAVMITYFEAMENLSKVLQRCFATALGLDTDIFDSFFDESLTRLKINHYPPQYDPKQLNSIGVLPHSDSGGFTILWQDDVGGLEIQNQNGDWVGAPPVEDTFVINLGNIMQIWTNGEFSSTPHRVINRTGTDRYSIPFFVNPNHDAIIKPLIGEPDESFSRFCYGDYQRSQWRRIFPVAGIPE